MALRGGAEGEVLLTDLRARLRDAVEAARKRAAAAPMSMAAAVEVAGGGLARTLRMARRQTAEYGGRFALREVAVTGEPCTWTSAADAVQSLWKDSAAVALALAQQPLPKEPPAIEVGTRGESDLPCAGRAWKTELERQRSAPFVAGKKEVAFTWAREPPHATPGMVWVWGPKAAKVDEELGVLLAKEARQRSIEAVSWREVDILTPIFVVHHPVTGKARLVHDLRAVNVFMPAARVEYERVQDALGRGSVAAKIDLLSAFRHCRLHETDRRRLGFAVGHSVFRWCVLPFGAAQSPEIFASALDGTINRIRREGLQVVVYVDDILVLAGSAVALDAAVVRLFDALKEDGWYVALDKVFIRVAAVRIPFLGLEVDLAEQVLRVSRAKAQKLSALCDALLQRRTVSLRDLQKVGGTLAFFAVAVPDVALARRGINASTAEAEGLPGRTVGVQGQLREDLAFWRERALSLPERKTTRPGEEWTTIVTDMAGAPARGWGAVAWMARRQAPDIDAWLAERRAREDEDAIAIFGSLPPRSNESSAALEVRAVIEALQHIGRTRPLWLSGRRIAWYCDAQSAVYSVRKWRSKREGLHRELRVLYELLGGWQAAIEPHWVARHLGWQPVADFLSRLAWRKATAEWSLPAELVSHVAARCSWQPTLDLFAATGNEQCPHAATRWPVAGRLTNAFARPWDGIRGWAFPPFSQIRRMWRHLEAASDARLLAVLPSGEPVPGSLRALWWMDLPPLPLVGLAGKDPPHPPPRPLRVVEVRSSDGHTSPVE